MIMLKESKFINKLKDLDSIVCVAEFGSYNTEYWIKDRSDIDLAVIVKSKVTFIDTLDLEEQIIQAACEYYKYDKIHLTFILFKDFSSKYARIAVDSDKKYIIDEERWYDFQHYVFKYARLNEKLEKTLKLDEHYYYFGGNIDEPLL